MYLDTLVDFVAARPGMHLVSDEVYAGTALADPGFVSVLEVAAAAAREDANAGPLAERVHVVYGVVQGPGPAGVPRVRHPLVQRRRRVGGHQDVELRPSVIADVAPAGVAPGRRGLHAAVHSGERAADRGAARAAGDSQRRVPGGQRGALLLGRHAAPGAGAHGVVRGRDLAVEEAGVLGRAQRLPGSSCHCSEPGWFRVCFANVSAKTLDVALQRLADFAEAKATRGPARRLLAAAGV
jgi:1-aminocyclopropane-1-carboxylate synthase